MSHPRLLAEDVAHHYISKMNKEYPHSNNIRRHLRLPLLAVTRRILMPRINYAEVEQTQVGSFGEGTHIDPTFIKCKEGLDWREYVSEISCHPNDPMKSETELSDFSDSDSQILHKYYSKRQPQGESKLSRRSLARMEAFLASCALAVPDEEIVPYVKGDSSNKKQPILNSLQALRHPFTASNKNKDTSTKQQSMKKKQYPQIHFSDIALRLEIYIRNIRRIYALREQNKSSNIECVINFDQPRVFHTRIQILLNSFIATTNSVGSLRPILTQLLTHLTRELLAVEHLSEELTLYIRKIVLEYEHLTSFASLAFLSSPGDSAETHLSPLLLKYLEYLKAEWKICVEQCMLESTLARAINPTMRRVFKTAEFLSIAHILDVCQEYKHHLDNIIILPRDFSGNIIGSDFEGPDDVIASTVCGNLTDIKTCNPDLTKAIKQALRDLRREIITVNGHVLPPVQSLTELVKLLRERLHTRTVKLKDKKVGYIRKGEILRENGEKNSDSSSEDQFESDSGPSYSNDNDIVSSGNEGDTSDVPCSYKKGQNEHIDIALPETKSVKVVKRRSFNMNAIDIITRRLLIAASRTGSGGDAFFVVRDLFGGEGLAVVPCNNAQSFGPYFHGKISPTIELTVRLTCIIIRCHSAFNIYPDPHPGEGEALIQLHTTTTETIDLQEVRVEDGGHLNQHNCKQNITEDEKRTPTKLMLKEKLTENSGRKVLSIKPARYERVEEWRTPS